MRQVCGSVEVLLATAFYPALILIDNGHFQYNNVSLGFFVAAVACILGNRDVVGSVLFSLALNYKQMELYHALPFFFYLLAKCFKERSATKLVAIGTSVIVTFALIWAPFYAAGGIPGVTQVNACAWQKFDSWLKSFLSGGPQSVPLRTRRLRGQGGQLLVLCQRPHQDQDHLRHPDVGGDQRRRHSPLQPGVEHPLVCETDTTVRRHRIFAQTTHLCILCLSRNFLLSLVNTSLVFYMFSFQVHEKSILLAGVPVAMLLGMPSASSPLAVVWFLAVSVFSMFPLLLKDGLALPTFALAGIFIIGADHLGKQF